MFGILARLLMMAVLLAPALAQKAETAPVPSQIQSAKKVFISNTAGDNLRTDDPTQVYRTFYAAIKSWGRYELVPTPSDADLVFEISFREPIVGVAVAGSGTNLPGSGTYTNPQLRLVILDPKTHVSLWWFMAYVRQPLFSSENILDRPITDLMAQLKPIASKASAATSEGLNSGREMTN